MSSSISYPHSTSPAPGVTVALAEGVEWLWMPLPFALNHINLWLLADGDGVAAIDTGYALDEVKTAWKSALAGRQLTRTIVTHGHPDHLGLAAWLETETGAPLWMTQGDYVVSHMICEQLAGYSIASMLELFCAHGLDEARADALRQRGNSYKLGVPAIPKLFHRILNGQIISIGGHDWRVIVGYGHATEHASLYCAELGILISGDMLLPRISTNVPVLACSPHDNPLKLFLDSIDGFRSLPADTLVLPSHGRPFHGLHARIDQLHEHHANRCEILLAACGEKKTAAELIPVLFDRDIPDPHQVMFAMGEAIAHLNYLEHAGHLIRTTEAGINRYATH